jgi:hypothetical protein
VSFLDDHPEIASIRTVAADLNGQPRGKRIARRFADKALDTTARGFPSRSSTSTSGARISRTARWSSAPAIPTAS